MLAAVLVLAPAWCQAGVPKSAPLAERLELEGALDNDTEVPRNTSAERELAAGDAALARAKDDPRARVEALESWRRALVASTPLDAVLADERRAIGVSTAVLDRLAGATLRAEFRERFEGLAQEALSAAGASAAALERVAFENPFTRAGALAELRLFDLFAEQGARAQALGTLQRLTRLAPAREPDLEASVRARLPLLPREAPAAPRPSGRVARTLELEETLAIAGEPGGSDRLLEPGAVAGPERLWIQAGERLVGLGARGEREIHPLAELVLARGGNASWVGAFGDPERAWPERPALENGRLALVLGRAREGRGNALALLDVTQSPPGLVWIRHDGEGAESAPLPGLLEYQPGPLAVHGLVVAQVLQWHDRSAPAAAPRVDGRRTRAWLVAFDAHAGQVVWKRPIAYGSDRRSRELDRFDEPRASSTACLPLDLLEGDACEVLCATELGVLARVGLDDGRLVESLRLRRARSGSGSGGPVGSGELRALAPTDSGGVVACLGDDRTARLLPGLERLLGLDEGLGLRVLGRVAGRVSLQRIELATGRVASALPLPAAAPLRGAMALPEGVLVAAGGALLLHGAGPEGRLTASLPLAGLEDEPRVGFAARGTRVWVLGLLRIWVVRLD